MTGWDVAWPVIIFLTKVISFLMKEFEKMFQHVSSMLKKFERHIGLVPTVLHRSDR